MELNLLIEQHAELTKKIQQSIESIKHWFERKINYVKEIFSNAKKKVLTKFSKTTQDNLRGKQLKQDIKDKNGSKIARKGEDAELIFIKLKRIIHNLLSKLKIQCDNIIKECQRGLRKLAGISDSQLADRNLIIIEEHKKNVVELINETATTVSLIANVVTSISILTISAIRVNKILTHIKDINNPNNEARDEEQDKEDAIEVEFSVV